VTAFDLLAAGVLLVPALVWLVIARSLWEYRGAGGGRWALVMALFASSVVVNNLVHVAWVLLHTTRFHGDSPVALDVVHDVSNLAIGTLGRHMLFLTPLPERRPGRGWLALNYGPAAVASILYAASHLLPGVSAGQKALGYLLLNTCFTVIGVLLVWQLLRVARPGGWGPEAAAEIRRSDLHMIGWGSLAAGLVFAIVAAAGHVAFARVLLEAGLFVAMAAPWIVRLLGFVIPEFLVTACMLAATAVVFQAHATTVQLADARYRSLLDFTAVLALGVLLAYAPAALRAWATRLVLRRSLRQQAELLAFLHTLSPELGPLECCRRALAELVRVRQLRGAAILLDDGSTLVHGTFNLEPLLRAWPRGPAADALPPRCYGTAELRQLPAPLRHALTEANVGLGAAPILSPRRRWGHLFLNTGLLGGTYREDDFEAFEAFVTQLALLLDAADLLARAVTVERSLAHAEKLSAIGELTARIAHDIRNPVTAARSLAQQLVREPGSPFAAEHGVILGELERVDRQVAALLRFARRDEFRFAPVDLGELVGATLATLGPRLHAAGITLETRATPGVVTRADGEKLRGVLVNLVENAIDALAGVEGVRRVAVSLQGTNGTATLGVTDSGPGVSAEALPHLFEPFFSLKAHGTGLGLAIAKRTIDAHGGSIEATSPPSGGMSVRVHLPLRERG
jgi:signal transduction histidine kinase